MFIFHTLSDTSTAGLAKEGTMFRARNNAETFINWLRSVDCSKQYATCTITQYSAMSVAVVTLKSHHSHNFRITFTPLLASSFPRKAESTIYQISVHQVKIRYNSQLSYQLNTIISQADSAISTPWGIEGRIHLQGKKVFENILKEFLKKLESEARKFRCIMKMIEATDHQANQCRNLFMTSRSLSINIIPVQKQRK